MKRLCMVLVVAMSVFFMGLAPKEIAYAEKVEVVPGDVQEKELKDFVTGKKCTYLETCVENESGKQFIVSYDKNINWPESEEELLARFLMYEGGTLFEKEKIADIVAYRVHSDDFPDEVRDVITQKNMFYVNAEFWNNMSEPSEAELGLATEALARKEHGKYRNYVYNTCNLHTELDVLETENYLFY